MTITILLKKKIEGKKHKIVDGLGHFRTVDFDSSVAVYILDLPYASILLILKNTYNRLIVWCLLIT